MKFLFCLFALIGVVVGQGPSSMAPPAQVSPPPPCIHPCPYVVAPVCAGPSFGCGLIKSFGNTCLLGIYNCQHPQQPYVVKYRGECYGHRTTPPAGPSNNS